MIYIKYNKMLMKNIFGLPKEGFHKKRFLGIALYDFIGTVFIAFLISYISKIHVLYCIIISFLFGIFCHYIFNVDTVINKLLNKLLSMR